MQRWLDQALTRLRDVGPVLAPLGFVAAAVAVLLPDRRSYVYIATLALVASTIFFRELERLVRWLIGALRAAAPYIAIAMILAVLLIVADLHYAVGRVERRVIVPYPPVPIIFKNSPLGGLFNASFDYQRGVQLAHGVPVSRVTTPQPGYTHAFTAGDRDINWVLNGNEASFSYDRHDDGFRADWSSSGGQVSFPDSAINRLVYQHLTFDCAVTGASGQPDLGLRLVVDDPGLSTDYKELAVYELRSLNQQFPRHSLTENWQRYEIYILGLTESPKVTHIGRSGGKDMNKINKLVFFVTDAMLGRSARGTVWIRNVVFSTSPQFAP